MLLILFVDALRNVLKGLKIKVRIKTMQTTARLKSARIERRFLKAWGDLVLLGNQWKSMRAGVKSLEKKKNNMHPLASVLENDTHKLLWNFDIQTYHLISARGRDFIIIYKKKKKKKRTCKILDFTLLADHRIKLKKKWKDLARKLKKLWNMKVTIIPIMIGAFGTVTKGLFKGLVDLEAGERVETIPTTALLKTARIVRRVLETWGDLLSLKQWKTIS